MAAIISGWVRRVLVEVYGTRRMGWGGMGRDGGVGTEGEDGFEGFYHSSGFEGR